MYEDVNFKTLKQASFMLKYTRDVGVERFKKLIIRLIKECAGDGARMTRVDVPYGMDSQELQGIRDELKTYGYETEFFLEYSSQERVAGVLTIKW